MNNPFHMAEHIRRSATSLYWNVCSLGLLHSCGPFTSLLCPRPWGLLPPLLPVFHRVHLSITPQKWYMGRTFFETLLLWICFIPLTMGYYLGCVWTSRLKIIFRQNCGKCSIVDCGHLLHCLLVSLHQLRTWMSFFVCGLFLSLYGSLLGLILGASCSEIPQRWAFWWGFFIRCSGSSGDLSIWKLVFFSYGNWSSIVSATVSSCCELCSPFLELLLVRCWISSMDPLSLKSFFSLLLLRERSTYMGDFFSIIFESFYWF